MLDKMGPLSASNRMPSWRQYLLACSHSPWLLKPMLWYPAPNVKDGLSELQSPLLPIPVSEGWNEVEAAVDTVVLDVFPIQSTFIPEVLFKLLIYVVGNRFPTGEGTGQGMEAVLKFHKMGCSDVNSGPVAGGGSWAPAKPCGLTEGLPPTHSWRPLISHFPVKSYSGSSGRRESLSPTSPEALPTTQWLFYFFLINHQW